MRSTTGSRPNVYNPAHIKSFFSSRQSDKPERGDGEEGRRGGGAEGRVVVALQSFPVNMLINELLALFHTESVRRW